MTKLTPSERQAIIKRVKEIDRVIESSRLTIDQIDKLHKERAALRKQLLEDRAGR
jgi:hypothetical protein